MKPKRQEREKGENRLWKFWKWSYGWKEEMVESQKVETKSWEPGKGAKNPTKIIILSLIDFKYNQEN